MRYQSEFAQELEKMAINWSKDDPFHVDMYEYMAQRLKEKYDIKEKQ